MKKILLIFALIHPFQLAAESWQNFMGFGTRIEIETAQTTQHNETQKVEFQLSSDVDIELSENSKLKLQGRLRHDTENHLDKDNTSLELREFVLETTAGDAFLTLGKQQVVWGKADGLKILDVINPQDWREFILDDFDDSRIPLWAVNVEYPVEDNTLQLITVLQQQYHKRADLGTAYEFTSSLYVPVAPSTVPVSMNSTKQPDTTIENADVGFRWGGFAGGWDYSVNYFYHYDDNPVLFRSVVITEQSTEIVIKPYYKRSHLIGGTLSNAFGDVTIRAELGYFVDRYFSTNNVNDADGVVENDEFAYVLGVDWFGLSDTLVSVQLFQSSLKNDQPGLLRDPIISTTTFLLERDFLNETLKARFLWLHNLNRDDGLLRPKISYDYSDEITWWLGADIFYGSSKGFFGQFSQNDRVLLGIEIGI